PFEIPDNMSKTIHEDGLIASATYGVIKGTVECIERLGVGIYEILTFPAPGPKKGYKPILTDPEFYGANVKAFRKDY
ncbi:MAG: exosortase system-associated protein, TIGR04073 family, partial [Candidatus Omnitrophica bacterium]|nr:exosortase system-associated protein, TIGR04073 family [Candidatus Omnitrophota bacterium]